MSRRVHIGAFKTTAWIFRIAYMPVVIVMMALYLMIALGAWLGDLVSVRRSTQTDDSAN